MSARLLWVDDEIDLLRPHCLFLEKRGYDITTASNGNDAVELCRTQRFDLVLLDENMPGLSGLETLAAIKEVQPDVPVVMVTKNEAETSWTKPSAHRLPTICSNPSTRCRFSWR